MKRTLPITTVETDGLMGGEGRRSGARSSAGDADGGKFAMFAPPSRRGDAGATLSRSVSLGEDGGNPANIAACEASNQQSAMPERLLTMDALVSIEPGS